jgi:hypothetical protein
MITMLSLICLACRAPWSATMAQHEKFPWCPFCGTALGEVTGAR